MSAPEPPIGSIWRTADVPPRAAVRGTGGWWITGFVGTLRWEMVESHGPLELLYTPPAPTLVERIVDRIAAHHDEAVEVQASAALAEFAAWVEEQGGWYVPMSPDTAGRVAVDAQIYRTALLAALRAEAGR